MSEKLEKFYNVIADKEKYLSEKEKKKVAYVSPDTPVELLEAAGLLPFRITGECEEYITDAISLLNRNVCSLVLAMLSEGLSGKFDVMEEMYFTDFCDGRTRLCDVWKKYISEKVYMFHVPKQVSQRSKKYLRVQLEDMKKHIEEVYHCEITDEKLKQAIKESNKTKRYMNEIFDARRKGCTSVSAKDCITIVKSTAVGEREEINEMLSQLVDEIKKDEVVQDNRKRVLICGSYFDNFEIIDTIEKNGVCVIAEVNSNGLDNFESYIQESEDPLGDLTEYYFQRASRVHLINSEMYSSRIEECIDKYNVDAVVFYSMVFCDNKLIDLAYIKKRLQKRHIPLLHIQGERNMHYIENLKTRIQAFLEM